MSYKSYKGTTLIKKIYKGSNKIKKIYKGSTLVWQADPYEPGTVMYESATAGATSTLNLEEGLYQVICIAGGGGGAGTYSSSHGGATSLGGGSGSGFNCIFNLSTGSYTVIVGGGGTSRGRKTGIAVVETNGDNGGNSQFGTSYAYGGGGASCKSNRSVVIVGAGGSYPTITYPVTTSYLTTAGNAGELVIDQYNAWANGGSSVYGDYGKGGRVHADKDNAIDATNGNNGYVKVVYIGQA